MNGKDGRDMSGDGKGKLNAMMTYYPRKSVTRGRLHRIPFKPMSQGRLYFAHPSSPSLTYQLYIGISSIRYVKPEHQKVNVSQNFQNKFIKRQGVSGSASRDLNHQNSQNRNVLDSMTDMLDKRYQISSKNTTERNGEV